MGGATGGMLPYTFPIRTMRKAYDLQEKYAEKSDEVRGKVKIRLKAFKSKLPNIK